MIRKTSNYSFISDTDLSPTFTAQFLSNFFAPTLSILSFAPFERAVLIVQTQASNPSLSALKYRNVRSALRGIFSEPSLTSPWRTALTSTLRSSVNTAANNAVSGMWAKTEEMHLKKQPDAPSLFLCGLAAIVPPLTVSLILQPLDAITIKLAGDMMVNGQREFKGIWDCISKIIKREGIMGLFQGYSALMLITIIKSLTDSLSYSQKVKDKLTGKDVSKRKALLDFLSVLTSFFVIHPLEVVHRRLTAQIGSSTPTYKSVFDCVTKIWDEEGFRGFYRGWWETLLGSLCISVIETGVLALVGSVMAFIEFKRKTSAANDKRS